MNRPWLIGLLGLALTGLPASAEEVKPKSAISPTDENSKSYVVIVGAGAFDDPAINPRPAAEADAKALYDLLSDKQYLGADQITLLLSTEDKERKSQPATKANILAAVKKVVAEAKKDDLVVIALFGQGSSVGERTCLFGSDGSFKERAKSAVASAELESELEKLKSQKLLALVDINYNKAVDPGKEVVLEPNPVDMLRVFVGSEDKEEHTLPQGRVVFLASNSAKANLDIKGRGAFRLVLLDALRGKADIEGDEPDGLVTVDELMTYLDKELPELARTQGATKEERELAPVSWGGRTSHFPITFNPAVMPKVTARLEKLARLAADKQISPEIADEGKRLLSRMPKLKAQRELRKGYQKLVDGDQTVKAFLTSRDKLLASLELDEATAQKFANRVLEAIDVIRESYVKELNLGEMVGWSIKGLYRRLEEKVPDEIKTRLDGVKEMRKGALRTLLVDVRTQLGKREDLEGSKDADTAIQMMMSNLDPYTNYIDEERLRQFRVDTEARFTGVGIQIRRDQARDALLVVTPIKGSPAYKAGIKTGDYIISIVREVDEKGNPLNPPETLSTKGLAVGDAVKKILGTAGTKVTLYIERDGVKEPMKFDIIRGTVEVETVLGYKRNTDDSWDFYVDPTSKIGYIRLTQFAPRSAKDMEDAVKKLDKTGLKGLVLDLRFNPGGLLTSAVKITDLFIDDGLIVTIKPRVGQEASYGGEHDGSYLNFPMVCLVNGGSASGSEIVSAALQDHDRAVIMGERSYGKGSVQNIQPFAPTGGQIKLTTASFWRPNGKNLNKSSTKGGDDEDWGVRPKAEYTLKLDKKELGDLAEHLRDQEVIGPKAATTAPTESKAPFKDRQLEMAVNYLKEQIKMATTKAPKKAG